jgi:hypothetical protein
LPNVSAKVNVGPNIYYKDSNKNFQVVQAAFPPKMPKMPTPQKMWTKVLRPLFWLAIGGSFLGQFAAFSTQLFKGESDIKE